MDYFILLLGNAIVIAGNILSTLIFIRILLSWFGIRPGGAITNFIYGSTELVYYPARELLNNSPFKGTGVMLDFTPILAYFLINFGTTILLRLLGDIANYAHILQRV